MDAFTGEIRAFAFGYVPRGWAPCYGQTLPIMQYTPLYSVIGVTYGGDGKTTFGLPNLQGQAVIGFGTSATSGTPYVMGETGGDPTVTLLTSEMPNHTHPINGASAIPPIPNTVAMPANNTYLTNVVVKNTATTGTIGRGFAPATATPVVQLNLQTIGVAGGSQQHQNMMPYVTMTYCICLVGDVYPVKP